MDAVDCPKNINMLAYTSDEAATYSMRSLILALSLGGGQPSERYFDFVYDCQRTMTKIEAGPMIRLKSSLQLFNH